MTPKSLRGKRTQAQFDFDWGVKGWAFTRHSSLESVAARARDLYKAIGFVDERRLEVLRAIEEAATRGH